MSVVMMLQKMINNEVRLLVVTSLTFDWAVEASWIAHFPCNPSSLLAARSSTTHASLSITVCPFNHAC